MEIKLVKNNPLLNRDIFGADIIYINIFRAARESDYIDCEAKISTGSKTHFLDVKRFLLANSEHEKSLI
jgi:hypothetical protein